ncbi:gametocyte-specific factor 1-like isoform X2 [Nerophis ophidion]|uniref:gametocyte-specific factor 1-like isoform X2 n=1 Tax=Nerophis ophidion TaxID=159077 RepID=UPI002AE0A19A|nr:gametocyte-specific factor 1-like isoform X2 [Nerophis ophidion]
MTTIRFGSSIGPCQTRSVERMFPEEPEEKGDYDPDRLFQCPFDKNHQIRVGRLPYHIIKCRKNHPKLAMELRTCPFNACHLVPKEKLASHTDTCPYKISMDTDSGVEKPRKWEVPVRPQFSADMTEDWENEVDEAAVPFVWGKNTHRSEARPTNIVASNIRPPTSLPW